MLRIASIRTRGQNGADDAGDLAGSGPAVLCAAGRPDYRRGYGRNTHDGADDGQKAQQDGSDAKDERQNTGAFCRGSGSCGGGRSSREAAGRAQDPAGERRARAPSAQGLGAHGLSGRHRSLLRASRFLPIRCQRCSKGFYLRMSYLVGSWLLALRVMRRFGRREHHCSIVAMPGAFAYRASAQRRLFAACRFARRLDQPNGLRSRVMARRMLMYSSTSSTSNSNITRR